MLVSIGRFALTLRRSIQLINLSERKVFRTYHFTQNVHCLNKDLIAVTEKNPPDDVIDTIKRVKNSSDLFNTLRTINKPLKANHVMESLRILFRLQKNKESDLPKSEIAHYPEFEKLCIDLKTSARFLEINDIIDAIKILMYFNISVNTKITDLLLNYLRKRVNELQLGHILFLDFLLQKCEKTPLIEALLIALPTLFQIQLKTQMDYENVTELTELLSYASRNQISSQCTMNIVSALTLHGISLKPDQARSIILSLCTIQNFKTSYEKLLSNCFIVLNKTFNNLKFDDIDYVLGKITEKYNNSKNEAFYNEQFYNNCAAYTIEMDVGLLKASYFLKKFNKRIFASLALLDYMSEKIIKNSIDFLNNTKSSVYIDFITGLSMANFIPKQWDKLKPIILSHHMLKSNRINLPWMRLCANLIVIDCLDESTLNKVFENEFLTKYLSRENNKIDYIQMLNLYQNVVLLMKDYTGNLPNESHLNKAFEINRNRYLFPIQKRLEYIFGDAKYVCTKVTTNYGHLIDHVVIFDENNHALEINTDETCKRYDGLIYLEDLPVDENKVICIQCMFKSRYLTNFSRLRGIFEIRLKCLEALGVKVIPINLKDWEKLPEKEQLPFLEREIGWTLKKIDVKN